MSATIAARTAHIERTTLETRIVLDLDLDGGEVAAATGVPFLDHMLSALGKHGRIGLVVACDGDAEIDPHHTVEDVGIVIGQALKQSLGDRRGIQRYGFAYAPLDEALARAVVDCSGRPFLHYQVDMPEAVIGRDFSTTLVEEFWRSLAMNSGLTMHIDLLRARNAHHAAEAIFKAGALAIRQAVSPFGDPDMMPSTKGVLA
jgi:imidazoleglycerol-phosphate dehydratase